MEKRYDLHVHTTKSDGTHTPEQVLHLAKKAGLAGISITDHDTISAYDNSLFSLADSLSLELLTGVEITSRHGSMNVHVLAYGFDCNNVIFQNFLESVRKKRSERNKQIFDCLQEHGLKIAPEDIGTLFSVQPSVVGRLHIARLLLNKGYVSSLQQAFDLYLNEKKAPWGKCPKISTEDVIKAIHQANAKAVLAHPFFLRKSQELDEILSMDLDGIEAKYGNIGYTQGKYWEKMADAKGWIVTGGSDFHGTVKPDISVGASFCLEETITKLFFHD